MPAKYNLDANTNKMRKHQIHFPKGTIRYMDQIQIDGESTVENTREYPMR
jgi:hypothetical protein